MFNTIKTVCAVAALMVAASSSAAVLTGSVSADNGFTVYVSTADNVAGTVFGGGNAWWQTYTSSTVLATGTNYYLHVAAFDEGGIAGFLGDFSLTGSGHKFANGLTTLTTNSTDWMGNNSGFGSSYGAVGSLGGNGAGPWGTRPDIGGSATWIWAGHADLNNQAYFTTKVSAVPEPTSVALFGLGILGLGFARRRSAKAK